MATAMLRGASAEAMADLRAQLGTPATLADAATIGDELFSVSDLLRADPALRRFATDASVPAEARKGLARQVFEGKVSAATLAIVESAFGHRWTSQRDLPDVLEHEPRTFTEAQKAELNGRGYSLKEVAPSYGNQQVLLWRKKTGNVDAASDPRGIGLAAGTTVHY